MMSIQANVLAVLLLCAPSLATDVRLPESSIRWGNTGALSSCFGVNFSAAGLAISHCFHGQSTFNTCCLMDKSMRDGYTRANNPTGRAALQVYRQLVGNMEAPDDATLLTPWCTETGAQSCSHFIVKESNQLAKVKFVQDPVYSLDGSLGQGYCLGAAPADRVSDCESEARVRFGVPSHAIPGVSQPAHPGLSAIPCKQMEGSRVDLRTCTPPAALGQPVQVATPV